MKFVPIKAVLNFISSAVQEEEASELQLMSWAFQALRMIDIPQRFERKVCILEVIDHKVKLPLGWREINMVSYLHKEPNQKDIDSLTYCYKKDFDSKCKDEKEYVCKLPLTYALFINSSYYNNNYKPMQNKLRNKGVSEYLCKLKHCEQSFSIKGDYIYTSIKEGFICLDYETEYKLNGEYQVPDDVDLLRGMAEYVKYMHWEKRADRHEQNAFRRSETHLQKANLLLMKAKGKFLLRSIDVEVLKSITFGKMKIIHTPAAFAYRETGF